MRTEYPPTLYVGFSQFLHFAELDCGRAMRPDKPRIQEITAKKKTFGGQSTGMQNGIPLGPSRLNRASAPRAFCRYD